MEPQEKYSSVGTYSSLESGKLQEFLTMNRNSSETDVYKPYGAYKLSETFSEKDFSGPQKGAS